MGPRSDLREDLEKQALPVNKGEKEILENLVKMVWMAKLETLEKMVKKAIKEIKERSDPLVKQVVRVNVGPRVLLGKEIVPVIEMLSRNYWVQYLDQKVMQENLDLKVKRVSKVYVANLEK